MEVLPEVWVTRHAQQRYRERVDSLARCRDIVEGFKAASRLRRGSKKLKRACTHLRLDLPTDETVFFLGRNPSVLYIATPMHEKPGWVVKTVLFYPPTRPHLGR